MYDAIDGALARTESIDYSEVEYLANYLSKMDLLITSTNASPLNYCVVSVEVYSHLEDARHASRPNQAFVAMWFDTSMSELYDEGIRPAIEDAGYEACRIDQRDSIGKIDDEIVREIRRSRFMVADFTQGGDGNRGSVYYEAGLARGLGMPIISTCREDQMKTLAFDTRQYAHIGWNDLEALRKELADRIGASIGEGGHSGEDDE